MKRIHFLAQVAATALLAGCGAAEIEDTEVAATAEALTADAAVHTYKTVGTNVNVRSTPFSGASIVTTIPKSGTNVTVTCYTDGSSVNGDKWWYMATVNGKHGYIAGYWLNTGHDPNTAVPFCGP